MENKEDCNFFTISRKFTLMDSVNSDGIIPLKAGDYVIDWHKDKIDAYNFVVNGIDEDAECFPIRFKVFNVKKDGEEFVVDRKTINKINSNL